jgi:type VI protein secretion system component VasK
MKTFNLLLLALSFIVLTSTGSYSQNDTSRAAAKEKLKKIVKEKLMEKMNLDDATATKLIELSAANRKEMKELRKKEKDLTDYIFDNPQSSDVGTKIEDHYAKLKAFLTPTQIAQSMVFQKELVKFMKKEMKLDKKDGKDKDHGPGDGNRELF